tara:strand:+ start:20074 stop:20934 length:861 start_codon:yes stop_codon:yes gene_type:complete
MKLKNLFFILVASIVIFSCKKDETSATFDAEAQAKIDDDILIEYLQSHYLNDEDGGIWTITNGESSLMGQVDIQNISYNDISYKLYYLKQQEGVTISPSGVDSINYSYTGMLLDSTVFDSKKKSSWGRVTNTSPTISLESLITGWQYAFTLFKGGNVVVNSDESFYYENYGKGILFIPSGLAYGNRGSQTGLIGANSPLIFEITLQDVKLRDHDLDGVLSKFEDLNNDNNFLNDDTDGDGIVNYLDVDDDNDGTLTKDEDTDGDGDPTNDDADGDGTPDYLDTDKV